jgi:SagB-type dehydrogenase family enzyme
LIAGGQYVSLDTGKRFAASTNLFALDKEAIMNPSFESANPTMPTLMPLAPIPFDPGLSDLGVPLMQILNKRKSTRAYSDRPVSMETLSHLLWAAFGINRSDGMHRTAPSAENAQEIDIYVVLEQGVYLFDPTAFELVPISKDDIRAATGWQDFVANVPVNLIYVANLAKMYDAPRPEQKFYAALDAGFIGENVYLFCAAQGLGTIARGWIDRPALAKRMNLRPEQRVIMAQSVGYPQE